MIFFFHDAHFKEEEELEKKKGKENKVDLRMQVRFLPHRLCAKNYALV